MTFLPGLAAYVRQCRSCDADIIWARTMTGRQMPVDAEPTEGGTVLLENRQGHIRATVYPDAGTQRALLNPETRKRLHASHFATCPDANAWRRRDHR